LGKTIKSFCSKFFAITCRIFFLFCASYDLKITFQSGGLKKKPWRQISFHKSCRKDCNGLIGARRFLKNDETMQE